MTSELKPCPFCGGKAKLDSATPPTDEQANSGWPNGLFGISCEQELHCGSYITGYPSVEAATEHWNTRAVPDVPELVIVSHEVFYAPTREWRKTTEPDYYRKNDSLVRDLIDKDQAVSVIAAKDAEIERITKSRSEAWQSEQKWKDRYNREVLGLNNEGDPIGGDPAYGLKHRAETAEAKLAQIEKQEAVAWLLHKAGGSPFTTAHENEAKAWKHGVTPLYTAPAASDADLRAERERLREAAKRYLEASKGHFHESDYVYDGELAESDAELFLLVNPSEPRT